ncbi:HAMP domain-containing sensor histidine kinase [Bacillus carboniphilus]|uniref:histidine kinase n=1 Tax=Bacillus carboniphilus TaxID=86663 RepID=A0ABY9JPE3_9BACI|nr:HAMP domain-containing sensor histidine kinase [Bacillus carboniphilus]WLR41272.1 HAMP domain-containing sensor histidine kinase [Bacillus carboniphilus]
MKNRPIWQQLLIIFTCFSILIGGILSLVIPMTLNSFFTNEIYRTIEDWQNYQTRDGLQQWEIDESDQQSFRSVKEFVIHKESNQTYRLNKKDSFSIPNPIETLNSIIHQAISQEEESKRYEKEIDGKKMFYVIKNSVIINGQEFYLVSFLWETYREELVSTLLQRLYLVLGVVLLGAVVLSIFFSKWFVKPLVQIQRHVQKLAKKKWNEPLELDRTDEIGVLASSIEVMRQQLKKQDETQQTMLQHVSHDLKTPVMVIRSYAEALKDGIYPSGSLVGSAEVIEEEAAQLEKKIKNLLYLTKLDYLASQKRKKEKINIKLLVEQVIIRLHHKREEVNIDSSIEDVTIIGDHEQWKIFFENMIDNALKYAKTKISIDIYKTIEGEVIATFKNDGDPISEEVAQSIFKPFVKGENGNFGLGLAIMKRIADLHNVKLTIENSQNGVVFSVEWEKR